MSFKIKGVYKNNIFYWKPISQDIYFNYSLLSKSLKETVFPFIKLNALIQVVFFLFSCLKSIPIIP